jgi:hypothetical protein
MNNTNWENLFFIDDQEQNGRTEIESTRGDGQMKESRSSLEA